MFGEVLDNTVPYLEKGRYLGIVIGDKYLKGTWIPLGFYIMNEVLKREFYLKSIIVKNFEQTRGKRNQQELWRYRALVGGFYIFKHEYILLFKKEKPKMPLLSAKEVRNLKLSSIPLEKLKEFAGSAGQNNTGSATDIINFLANITHKTQ